MSLRKKLISTLMLLALGAAPAQADQLELVGTIRDFKDAHSDMQRSYSSYPLVTGMVKKQLGEDNLPVLNPPLSTSNSGNRFGSATITSTFNSSEPTSVRVVSNYSLSAVKLKFSDNSTQTFSNLSNTSGTYAGSGSNSGKMLVGCWVKSGTNGSANNNQGEWFAVSAGSPAIPASWRVESTASFNQWYRNVENVNKSIKHSVTLDNNLDQPGGVYTYAASIHNGQSFFPIDNKLWGNEGRNHNFHFTYNLTSRFTYTDPANREPMIFNFSGDDDVWVFINRKLVIDLGGVHSEMFASVNVDDLAEQLGLEVGKSYDFHFFFAERHTTQSNFTIETTMQFISPLYD